MEDKSKQIIGILIALVLVSIILPMSMSIFSTSSESIAPCVRTNVLGPAFYNNKTQTELISTQEDFNVTTTYSISDSADVYIDFIDGYANDTIDVEIVNTTGQAINTKPYFTSFKVSGWLENVSVNMKDNAGDGASVDIYLLPSIWSNILHAEVPIGTISDGYKYGTIIPLFNAYFWIDIVNRTYLDSSLTANDTWFIGAFDTLDIGTWSYTLDSGGVDNSLAYYYATGFTLEARDYCLKVGYSAFFGSLSVNGTDILVPDTYHFDYNATNFVDFDVTYSGSTDIDFLVSLNLYAHDDEFNLYSELDSICINLTILELYDDCSLYLNITNLSNMSELIEFNLTIDGVLLVDYDINDLLIVSNITTNTSIYMEISSNIGSGSIDFSIIAYYYCCSVIREKIYDLWMLLPILIVIGIVVLFIREYLSRED